MLRLVRKSDFELLTHLKRKDKKKKTLIRKICDDSAEPSILQRKKFLKTACSP